MNPNYHLKQFKTMNPKIRTHPRPPQGVAHGHPSGRGWVRILGVVARQP
jgi:hypothetical protein